MNLGPFHFTGEISLGNLFILIGLFWTCFKYLRHYVDDIRTTNDRMNIIWVKFNGKLDDNSDGWFYRMTEMERKVNMIWGRLAFNRLVVDETRTRSNDVG